MKKLIHFIYRTVAHQSTPVTDVATGKREIAVTSEFFGHVINIKYKPA